jgi:hypothetical protein
LKVILFLVIFLKIKELENLTKYLFSKIRELVISIGYIISFLIMALFFYKAYLISLYKVSEFRNNSWNFIFNKASLFSFSAF